MQHDLIQGSPEWVEFRKSMRGASEAAAMLGLSKSTKRTELLHMKVTGTAKEFSDFVQTRILDAGHRIEADARPHVEVFLGDDLYPVTMSDGLLSASCDGLTLDGGVAWEHKQWNEEYAQMVRDGEVPPEHIPQCMQVLMVTKASKLLFTISDGTADRMVHVVVHPDEEWFARIRAGWAQFDIDMQNYVHIEDSPKIEAEAIRELPALFVQMKGEVTGTNLPVFKAEAERFIAAIKAELVTDEDFVNADATVKFCDMAEKQLDLAKAQAIAQTASIDDLMRTVNAIQDQLRSKRLTLSKLVESRKKQIKQEIEQAGVAAWDAHMISLDAAVAPLSLVAPRPDLATAMKNKRTLSSLRDAVDTAVANAKIVANELAAQMRAKLAWYKAEAAGNELLFSDLQTLVQKPDEDFKLAVKTRIAADVERQQKARESAAAAVPAPAPVPAPAIIETAAAPSPSTYTTAELIPSLRLGMISERLGFAVTADFLRMLGFEPAGRERAAVLYRETDFRSICAAIQRHISTVQAKF